MATEEERRRWQTDPDAAYAEAERRISAVRTARADTLKLGGFDGNALKTLQSIPPTIVDIVDIRALFLSNTQISNISVLARLKTLQAVFLENTQITDIAPLAKLGNLQALRMDNTKVADLMPIRGIRRLRMAAENGDVPHGLFYTNTLVAARPVFRELIDLGVIERTVQTLQYLNGAHPDHAGPPSIPAPSITLTNRAVLLANPPAEPVIRRGTIDLDPGPPGDTPADKTDRELAELPRRQRNLADQICDDLGQNQKATRRALIQYRDELARPPDEIILEIFKEAYLTAKAGIEQARREGSLDDDAFKAWDQFETNHELYLAHYPLDIEREHHYRNAPVNMDKANPAEIAKAFEGFLDALGEETVAAVVGPRLLSWAENSTYLSRIIVDMAQNAMARGDISDENMPHRIWLRRQVAQGWAMMMKLKEFLAQKASDRKFRENLGLMGSIASLLGLLTALLM